MGLLTREIRNDYQIVYLDNMKVNEIVTENEDCTYTIFINNNLCTLKRLKAIRHALEHIEKNDFEKTDVQEIEYKRHIERTENRKV